MLSSVRRSAFAVLLIGLLLAASSSNPTVATPDGVMTAVHSSVVGSSLAAQADDEHQHLVLVTTADGVLHAYDVQQCMCQWRYAVSDGLLSLDFGEDYEPGPASAKLIPALDGSVFVQGSDRLLYSLPGVRVSDIVNDAPFATPAFPGVYFMGQKRSKVHALDFNTLHVSRSSEVDAGGPFQVRDRLEAEQPSCRLEICAPDLASNASDIYFNEVSWHVQAFSTETHEARWGFEFRELASMKAKPEIPLRPPYWEGQINLGGTSVRVGSCQLTLESSVQAAYALADMPAFLAQQGRPRKTLQLVRRSRAPPANHSPTQGFGHSTGRLLAPVEDRDALSQQATEQRLSMSGEFHGFSGVEAAWAAGACLNGDGLFCRDGAGTSWRGHDSAQHLLMPPATDLAVFQGGLSQPPKDDNWLTLMAILLIITSTLGAASLGFHMCSRSKSKTLYRDGASQCDGDDAFVEGPLLPQGVREPSVMSAGCGPDECEVSSSAVPGSSQLAANLSNGHLLQTFRSLSLIGQGGFGVVYRAIHYLESAEYALKFVPIELGADEEVSSSRDFREISSMIRFRGSRHVVRYLTCWVEEPQYLPEILNVSKTVNAASSGVAHANPSPVKAACASARFDERRSKASSVGVASQTSTSNASLGFDWVADSQVAPAVEPESQGRRKHASVEAEGQAPVNKTSKHETKHSVVLVIHMELVKGMTLRAWLDSPTRSTVAGAWTKLSSNRPSPQSATTLQRSCLFAEFEFGRQLLKALADIHASQIVHRDLKPTNIFVDEQHILKIGDFGLARSFEASNAAAGCTVAAEHRAWHWWHMVQPGGRKETQARAGSGLVGTLGYLPPEGNDLRTSDKADIYAVGLVLLELLSPRPSTAMQRVTLFEDFKNAGQLPRHLGTSGDLGQFARLLLKMRSELPEDRPSAADAYSLWRLAMASFSQASTACTATISAKEIEILANISSEEDE